MVKKILVSSFKEILGNKLKAELQEYDNDVHQEEIEDKQYGKWSTTWWQQCQILFRRGLKERVIHFVTTR